MAVDKNSPANQFLIYLLDVGTQQYGDCILCRFGKTTVLIDGSHPRDSVAHDDHPSIPDQLAKILGGGPPFPIDLLVVTHCHVDHIGCLPTLIKTGQLDVTWALLADERLGFARYTDGDDAADALPPGLAAVVSALREEPRGFAGDADIKAFLEDAANLESSYNEMLATLAAKLQDKLVRYTGEADEIKIIEKAFAGIGLKILGPTQEQLLICGNAIAQSNRDSIDNIRQLAPEDGPANPVGMYRALAQPKASDFASDRVGKGAALNNQSIVLCFSYADCKVLLTGDMQFAAAEVPQLDAPMAALFKKVIAQAPFDFVKLAHHGSYNGLDDDILNGLLKGLENPRRKSAGRDAVGRFGISGGVNDATHPDPGVLKLLLKNRQRVSWARTDRNGMITVTLGAKGAKIDVQRGKLDNGAANDSISPGPTPVSSIAASSTPPKGVAVPTPPTAPAVQLPAPGNQAATSKSLKSQPLEASNGDEVVEVLTRVPHRPTRVSVTIEVQPATALVAQTDDDKKNRDPGQIQLAGGRRLPRLLFVTSRDGLARNIGASETEHALNLIRQAVSLNGKPHKLLDTNPRDGANVAESVRAAVDDEIEGVVLLGGYDIIPAQILDVLDPAKRSAVADNSDPDNFYVWSDAIYGRRDAGPLPVLPVSRIPDGKDPVLVLAALTASFPTGKPLTRSGVRNQLRPFAGEIYNKITGDDSWHEGMLCSGPADAGAEGWRNGALNTLQIYMMLHGSDSDATRFWGESDAGLVEAFQIDRVADKCHGVVFTGCCWGAMPVNITAQQAMTGQPVAARTSENSIALRFLQSGVLAYIGCTGVHYSPTEPPYDYFGGPMHALFWNQFINKQNFNSPAKALFEAKKAYVLGIPHVKTGAMAEAIELKIVRQYTCLGLGW